MKPSMMNPHFEIEYSKQRVERIENASRASKKERIFWLILFFIAVAFILLVISSPQGPTWM